MKYIIFISFLQVFSFSLFSQSVNDILNILVEQKYVSQAEADPVRADKSNAITKVDLCISYMLPSESFQIIKKSGNSSLNLTWIYLSFTLKPQLLG